MASMGKYQCANPNCQVWFEARTAERARGNARSCSKACASVVRILNHPKANMFEVVEPAKVKPSYDSMYETFRWG